MRKEIDTLIEELDKASWRNDSNHVLDIREELSACLDRVFSRVRRAIETDDSTHSDELLHSVLDGGE